MRRAVDLAGRVDIADVVEHARLRPGLLARRLGCRPDGSHVVAHRRRPGGPRLLPAGCGPDQFHVLVDPVDRAARHDEHRDPERAQLGDRVGGREPGATGDDEVGVQADDLLDIDGPEVDDVGQRLRLGWVVARVVGRDDPVTGADREQGLGHGRGQRDDLLRLRLERDGRAFVIGQGHREPGPASGSGSGRPSGQPSSRARAGERDRRAALGALAGGAACSRREDEDDGRQQVGDARRVCRDDARNGTVRTGTGTRREPPGRDGRRRGRARTRNPSLRTGSKEGLSGIARVLPTFLSKVRACTVWPATGLALSRERSP